MSSRVMVLDAKGVSKGKILPPWRHTQGGIVLPVRFPIWIRLDEKGNVQRKKKDKKKKRDC